jgi:uncharacterized membrane protein YccC
MEAEDLRAAAAQPVAFATARSRSQSGISTRNSLTGSHHRARTHDFAGRTLRAILLQSRLAESARSSFVCRARRRRSVERARIFFAFVGFDVQLLD